ncbi:MAG: ABC transporter ATP-binding protein [Acidimicrobiia bacterium]
MTSLLSSVRVALETLRRNPLRTSLSVLGIVMGAASLTAVLALGDGMEAFARRSIEREGWQVVQVTPVTEGRVDGLVVPHDDYPVFTADHAERMQELAGAGTRAELFMDGTAMLPVPGGRDRAVLVRGLVALPDVDAERIPVAQGRHVSADEARTGANVVVINDRLSRELKTLGLAGGAVGEHLTMGGHAFEVVGVLAPDERTQVLGMLLPVDVAETVMVPSPRPRPRSLALHLADVEAVGDVRDRLQQFVSQQPGWQDRVRVSALGKERLEQLAQGILMFKLLMGAFTAISLLVGGVGIMNVLLASILERTREIGVRKAVGARRRDVLWQFLIESVTISAAGTAVGLALGIAGAFGVTAIIRAQTDAQMYAAWTWQTGAVAAVAAMTIGMLAGLYPAVRAARLTPLDAIQRE